MRMAEMKGGPMPQVVSPLYNVPRGDFSHFPSQKAAFRSLEFNVHQLSRLWLLIQKVIFFLNNKFLEGFAH